MGRTLLTLEDGTNNELLIGLLELYVADGRFGLVGEFVGPGGVVREVLECGQLDSCQCIVILKLNKLN